MREREREGEGEGEGERENIYGLYHYAQHEKLFTTTNIICCNHKNNITNHLLLVCQMSPSQSPPFQQLSVTSHLQCTSNKVSHYTPKRRTDP